MKSKIGVRSQHLTQLPFQVLGLTKKEQLEVHRAVVELVKNRLVKTRSA